MKLEQYSIGVGDRFGHQGAAADRAVQERNWKQSHYIDADHIGVKTTTRVTEDDLIGIGRKYLFAVQVAGRIYRHIAGKKGAESFVAEVSTDEAIDTFGLPDNLKLSVHSGSGTILIPSSRRLLAREAPFVPGCRMDKESESFLSYGHSTVHSAHPSQQQVRFSWPFSKL